MPITLFIAYAHSDQALRNELANHLSSFRNQGIITDWFDGDISAGLEWEPQIFDHLQTARIILLLISADFIASRFCYEVEMQRALAKHAAKEARVIPIILRPTYWKNTPLAKLEALPAKGKPVTLWRTKDEAFLSIMKGIAKVIDELTIEAQTSVDLHATHAASNQQNASSPTRAEEPEAPEAPTITNSIGSIQGKNHTITMGGTIHTSNIYHKKSPRRKAH